MQEALISSKFEVYSKSIEMAAVLTMTEVNYEGSVNFFKIQDVFKKYRDGSYID